MSLLVSRLRVAGVTGVQRRVAAVAAAATGMTRPLLAAAARRPFTLAHSHHGAASTVGGAPASDSSATPAAATPTGGEEDTVPVVASTDQPSASVPVSPPAPAPLFLRMPDIEGVGKCRLLRWTIEVGRPFQEGEVLCEIDSDLAVIEYKAQSPGILALVRTQAGERITTDQVLALQVDSPDQIVHAEKWAAYVHAQERQDREEIEQREAKEEAAIQAEMQKEAEEKQQAEKAQQTTPGS